MPGIPDKENSYLHNLCKITEHSSSFAIFKNEAIQKSYRIKDFTISLYPLNYDKKG